MRRLGFRAPCEPDERVMQLLYGRCWDLQPRSEEKKPR